MNERQMDIMRHSLGLAQRGTEYRNYFDAGPADLPDCESLVDIGYMEKSEPSVIFPDGAFHVTAVGMEAVGCRVLTTKK